MLTRRQQTVLELLAEGLTYRQIAARLFVSRNTVKTHVAGLLERLDAHTAAQAVALGYKYGYLRVRRPVVVVLGPDDVGSYEEYRGVQISA